MAQPVVLLHGFTHTSASWAPVISRLGKRYTAIAPDLRGHGTAASSEPVTLHAVIGDIDALTEDRFTLVGYSMGGRIALHAALRLPRITRLILIGASPGIEDVGERTVRRDADERLAAEIDGMSIEAFAERWATTTPVLAGQPASLMAEVHTDRLRNTPSGLAHALRGLGTGALPSLWHKLAEVQVPVSSVVGARDHKFRTIAERMSARLPAARTVVVPGTGHAVHLEAPDVVAEIICRG